MATEFRLGDADRERFGGPEWFGIDHAALTDMTFERLRDIEAQMRVDGVPGVLDVHKVDDDLVRTKAMIWLARQTHGLTEPSYAEFDFRPLLALSRQVEKPDPLAESSEPPSEE